jgi:hypothetical protein
MGHVRRLALTTMFLFAIWTLGLIIDATLPELIGINEAHGAREGPFGPVIVAVENTAWALVPVLSAGVLAWLVYGSIQEERREEQRRRVRR